MGRFEGKRDGTRNWDGFAVDLYVGRGVGMREGKQDGHWVVFLDEGWIDGFRVSLGEGEGVLVDVLTVGKAEGVLSNEVGSRHSPELGEGC